MVPCMKPRPLSLASKSRGCLGCPENAGQRPPRPTNNQGGVGCMHLLLTSTQAGQSDTSQTAGLTRPTTGRPSFDRSSEGRLPQALHTCAHTSSQASSKCCRVLKPTGQDSGRGQQACHRSHGGNSTACSESAQTVGVGEAACHQEGGDRHGNRPTIHTRYHVPCM